MPPWLAARMETLGTAIAESVLHHYGRASFLSRLSDPFWFQALGSVMGMDWHSSGITTSVMNALKKGLNPKSHELGIYVCGGRGRQSRNTPQELRAIADRTSLDGDALVRTSRLTQRAAESVFEIVERQLLQKPWTSAIKVSRTWNWVSGETVSRLQVRLEKPSRVRRLAARHVLGRARHDDLDRPRARLPAPDR